MKALINETTETTGKYIPGTWIQDKATAVTTTYFAVLTFAHPVRGISGEKFASREAAQAACVEHGISF